MKTLQFRCKLLSDVILNQKAATEGPNQTLDFIPGSCFLGIVASKLYPKEEEKNNENYEQKMKRAWEIFHSGQVRFGDAHPSEGEIRGLKIPASMFYPKVKPDGFKYYIHHTIPENLLESDEYKKMQLKQCRSGFYTFTNKEAKQVKTETNFAIKSAYDKDKRRSKDEQMYGYESLQEGQELYFDVQVDNEDLVEEIKDALIKGGSKRVGRSRTAQYGLVEITLFDYSETASGGSQNNIVTVYADGRLIFLDKYGLPTFRPEAKDLGLPEGANILWEKSQIRTFQYSPWNYQRKCFDTDRCGIEKGSVFVVDVTGLSDLKFESNYIGSYNNEGFGKVIYNPEFLMANPEDGIALFQISDQKKDDGNKTEPKDRKAKVEKEIENLQKGNGLLQYLAIQKHKEELESDVYTKVNEWVAVYYESFKGDRFASQWGHIRELAMRYSKKSDLKRELFTKQNDKHEPFAYLTHGKAAKKWDEKNRRELFRTFFDGLSDEETRFAIINLAAEMAKKCRKEEKQ